jgi:hypothetical protein
MAPDDTQRAYNYACRRPVYDSPLHDQIALEEIIVS